MERLNNQLDSLIEQLSDSMSFREDLKSLVSVYPFNQYEYILASLLSRKIIDFEQYQNIRNSYIDRNMFLYVYEISAPRGFGDTWAFGHLISVEPELKRPNKKIDPDYRGEYDLYISDETNIIKIEVKASRAVDRTKPDEPLYIKALSSDSNKAFLMNFQQLKPSCCDIYLWIAVYRDTVKYWVMKNTVIRTHKDFTPQHRNEGTSDRGKDYNRQDIFEGQIMITESNIDTLSSFAASGREILGAIKKEYYRS